MVTATKTTKTRTTKKAPVRPPQKQAAVTKRSARSLANKPNALAKSQSADSMLQDLQEQVRSLRARTHRVLERLS